MTDIFKILWQKNKYFEKTGVLILSIKMNKIFFTRRLPRNKFYKKNKLTTIEFNKRSMKLL